MAEIRQYRREKQKSEERHASHRPENDEDYDKRLREHKRKLTIAGIIGAIIVIAVIIVICFIRNRTSFTGYSIENSSSREDSGYAQFVKSDSGYIRFSRDGAAKYSYSGSQIWNKTYEINNLALDTNGSYTAAADLQGNDIFIFNNDGFVAAINTALPILQISVSSKGLVVAILEDTDADYINMYDTTGAKIYSIKRTIDGDGIPVSASVSDDGQKLVASLTAVDGIDIATSVVFWNFDEVGQNENERIVGGYDTYTNQLVPKVEFVNSSAAVAFGEKVISFFKVNEYPKLVRDVEIDYTIEQTFMSDRYVGIIHEDDKDGRILDVYDIEGSHVYDRAISEEYTSFTFSEGNVIMYSQNKCEMLNSHGKSVYSQTFEKDIVQLIPISLREYIYISQNKIERIKLK